MPDLEQDTTLRLPRVTVLKASAGSGKTFRLTQRYVQFLLSDRIPKNELRNLMAITFSNNASGEMRRNVVEWLKLLCLKDPERLREMEEVTSGGAERLSRKAAELIERILSRFSEFQVRTIDSFMSSVFRASALDFGFGPDFEVVLDAQPLVDYAWNLFLREAPAGQPQRAAAGPDHRVPPGFQGFQRQLAVGPVDPAAGGNAGKSRRSFRTWTRRPSWRIPDRRLRITSRESRTHSKPLRAWSSDRSWTRTAHSSFPNKLASARAGRCSDLLTGSMRNGPVKKPPQKRDCRHPTCMKDRDRVARGRRCRGRLRRGVGPRILHALSPPARGAVRIAGKGEARHRAGSSSATSAVASGTTSAEDMVPDVYFRIGERIWHLPRGRVPGHLAPAVENALPAGGKLPGHGGKPLRGRGHQAGHLRLPPGRLHDHAGAGGGKARSPRRRATCASSRRTGAAGRAWSISRRRFFAFEPPSDAEVPRGRAAERAGCLAPGAAGRRGTWGQPPRSSGSGYVEVEILERDEENPPEREKLQAVMKDLKARGYGWGDIALLAQRNADVVRATSWLNDMGVPFISFSSLDVRTRTVAGEMLALLSFLDSPPDDLAFATFVLGKIFARTLLTIEDGPDAEAVRNLLYKSRTQRPLYKAFQRAFPGVWKKCFTGLFRSAGYLPLYDLVSEACVRFDVFSLVGEEEATLAKLLEVVKEFEGSGANSLREFLGTAQDDAGADGAAKWAIDVPRSAPSVNAMTIHKAKGLGFPVVVVLLYGETSHRFEYSILRNGDEVRLVKITQDLAQRDPVLRELYDQETMKAEVDRLNRLYVALTRAKREMYVIGVKGPRDTFPFDLLPVESFAPSHEKSRPERKPVPASGPLIFRTRQSPCRWRSAAASWVGTSAGAESLPTGCSSSRSWRARICRLASAPRRSARHVKRAATSPKRGRSCRA